MFYWLKLEITSILRIPAGIVLILTGIIKIPVGIGPSIDKTLAGEVVLKLFVRPFS